jgi:hypothetical protein
MPKKKPAAATGSYVCGIAVADIRRAYFDGKIDELCANIMAGQSVTAEDIKALGAELEKLKTEELEFRKQLKAEVTGPLFKEDEGRPPRLDELLDATRDLTPEEQAKLDEWNKQRDWSVDTAKSIIQAAAKLALQRKPFNKEQLMTDAHAMTGLMIWLSEDAREKERLYKKRLIGIIDDFETTRREAEDRAQVTNEYVAFKTAEDLLKLADAFVMNAKKQYGGQFGG